MKLAARAKHVALTLLVMAGLTVVFGSSIGGGSYGSSTFNKAKASIAIETLVLEVDDLSAAPPEIEEVMRLLRPGATISSTDFDKAIEFARVAASSEAGDVRLQTPAFVVQHRQSGRLASTLGEHAFAVEVSAWDLGDGIARVAVKMIDDRPGDRLETSATFTSSNGVAYAGNHATAGGTQGSLLITAIRPRVINP